MYTYKIKTIKNKQISIRKQMYMYKKNVIKNKKMSIKKLNAEIIELLNELANELDFLCTNETK